MSEAEPQGTAPGLPSDLESSLLSLFEGPKEALEQGGQDLCARHPDHADAIRERLRRGMEIRAAFTTQAAPQVSDRWGDVGPYHILGLLGEGGMGTVYLAEQKKPVRRRVALKVIKLGMDTKTVLNRFEAERQALAMMEHESIARVFDCGATESGQPYFAMEYVKGEPITRYCDDNKLDIKDRLDLFLQICSGVQHAHNKGIIHRDLTPNNVLVTVQDGKPRVKIIDFGLARATDHRLVEATIYTEQGQIVGTPEYMSPEQAGLKALDIDTRSDIYTLGVLLYELLVGELPFSRETLRDAGLFEIQRIIREEDPPKPSTRLITGGDKNTKLAKKRRTDLRGLTRRVQGDLDWIVMQALEKDRTRRYETAREFAADIRRHLSDEPVLASPPSMGYRLRKFTRRYRAQVISGVLIFLVLVAGIITSLSFYFRAEGERKKAEQSATEARRQESIAKSERTRAQEKEAEARLAKANETEARRRAEDKEAEAQRERAAAQHERAAAEAHLARFNRLAVVVKMEDAEREAGLLFPAWPEKIGGLGKWIEERGEPLKDELPKIRTTLEELEARALPQSEEEKRKDREGHPRSGEYRARKTMVGSLQMAMDVREGKKKPLDAELAENLPNDVEQLNSMAWDKVDPDRKTQDYGKETLGLALARRALALAGEENQHTYGDTLAWALFANGLDEEAREASRAALKGAPEKEREKYKGYLQKLEKAIAVASETLATAKKELTRLEAEIQKRQTLKFEDDADRFLHKTMKGVEEKLVVFTGEKGSLKDVQKRLSWAERIDKLTRSHPNARVSWEEARQAIMKADGVVASKRYGRDRHAGHPIHLKVQLGLVPIGMNPKTKLWEFYHLRSAWDPGSGVDPAQLPIPEHGADGKILVGEETGVVFVLLPGGTFRMGAQKTDLLGPNFDPQAESIETPHEVTLSPYFLAKHELTQGQWFRLSGGEAPSRSKAGTTNFNRGRVTLAHPVEQVDWFMSRDLAKRHRLVLPTEAQWEYGCRGDTTTPWSGGEKIEDLEGLANILDRTAMASQPQWSGEPAPFSDGHVIHAPVGSFRANGFGLHDMHGNLWEWCQDWYGAYFLPWSPGNAERQVAGGSAFARVARGGSFSIAARNARSAFRSRNAPTVQSNCFGLRLARVNF